MNTDEVKYKVIFVVTPDQAGPPSKLLVTYTDDKDNVKPIPIPPDCRAIAVRADGKVAATANSQGVLELYDVTDELRTPRSLGDHPGTYRLVFSPDGASLWSFGQEDPTAKFRGKICQWNTATGGPMAEFNTNICPSGSFVLSDLAFDHEGIVAVVSVIPGPGQVRGDEAPWILMPPPPPPPN
jgi:hypothetical protein